MAALYLLAAGAVSAGESDIVLKEGEGRVLVESHCTMCHSLDYVQINSVFLDRKGWEASVNKMIKVMGAPIAPEVTGPIIDYLTKHYGK